MKEIILVLICICLISMANASTVSREISYNRVGQGRNISVNLVVDVEDIEGFYIISESIPEGMIVMSSDLNTIEDGLLKVLMFNDDKSSTDSAVYNYVLQDIGEPRTVEFDGIYIFQSEYTKESNILGDSSIEVVSCFDWDTDCDGCVSMKELAIETAKWFNGGVSTESFVDIVQLWYKGC